MKKLVITGNVGQDPELHADTEGNKFTTFSVAVSVGSRTHPKTDWVDVSCNNRLADVASKYIRKGSKVLIEGFPAISAYINKNSEPVGTTRLYASTLELLGHPSNHSNKEHDVSEAEIPTVESEHQVYLEDRVSF